MTRLVGQEGYEAQKVGDIMTSPPRTLDVTASVMDAATLMREGDFGGRAGRPSREERPALRAPEQQPRAVRREVGGPSAPQPQAARQADPDRSDRRAEDEGGHR